MIVITPPYWLYILIIILFIIYHKGWKDASWERKRDLGATIVVVITIILLPFHFWGLYNLTGIENGGMYEEWIGAFSLNPEETYTSETLSNRFVIIRGNLMLSIDSAIVTVYFSDLNLPEIHYSEVNCSGLSMVYIDLQYLFTEFSTPANWTVNFYNPNQNTSVYGTFEILLEPMDIILDASPVSPLLIYQLPTITLFSVWIVWGVITLGAYESQIASLRPKAERSEDIEFQEVEDSESPEEQKYRRIRERKGHS